MTLNGAIMQLVEMRENSMMPVVFKPYFDKVIETISECVEPSEIPQWIPCSERLPKEYGNYLITTHNGDVDVGTIDPKKKGVWSACDADGFYWIREVVAWMPLPEPAKLGGD